ncbi:MAG: hypothetical protein RLN62_01570 [Rickettsiales bacterium]
MSIINKIKSNIGNNIPEFVKVLGMQNAIKEFGKASVDAALTTEIAVAQPREVAIKDASSNEVEVVNQQIDSNLNSGENSSFEVLDVKVTSAPSAAPTKVVPVFGGKDSAPVYTNSSTVEDREIQVKEVSLEAGDKPVDTLSYFIDTNADFMLKCYPENVTESPVVEEVTPTPTATPDPVVEEVTPTPTATPDPVVEEVTPTPTATPDPVVEEVTPTPTATPDPVVEEVTPTGSTFDSWYS